MDVPADVMFLAVLDVSGHTGNSEKSGQERFYLPTLPFKLSRIAPWLRSAPLPLVNLGLQFTFSRFIRFRCELSFEFRYSPSDKIWSS
jgi:hypothetical protein